MVNFKTNLLRDFEMYSTYNEGKPVVAERFIRTLENKIFKYMPGVSKSFYFDGLDDIVNKYNNIVHWSEEVFVVSKIKHTALWSYVISDLNGEAINGSFHEKELQETSQEKFRIEKVLKRKGNKLYVTWKGYDNSFNSWIIEKNLERFFFNEILSLQMSQYFAKPFGSFGENSNVKVDLSNYATKIDLKNVIYVDASSFALKTNLAGLKTEVDKLDIDKLAPVPVDLSKLSDVVKNDVVKKPVHDKLVSKVNNIDTSEFVLKNKYQTDKAELAKKIPNANDYVKNTKLTELENKVLDISSLAKKLH